MLKSIISFLIGLLVFVLIVDPGDLIFRLKVPLFLLIFMMWIMFKTFKPAKISRDVLLINLILFFIPFVGIFVAMAQDTFTDQVFALGFIKSFSILFLLIVIVDLSTPLDMYLVRYSIAIPLIIIPIYTLLTLNPSSILAAFNYLSAKDVAKFSNRDFYGYKVVMLYYRTSPLLVFPLAYYCSLMSIKGKPRFLPFILIITFLFTLILSGTRANMLAGVVILIYYIFFNLNSRKNKIPLIIGSLFVIVGISLFVKSLSFSKKDSSSQVKSGHVDSYMKLFAENPHYYIWGEGLGSTFYSSGNGNTVSQTELTYFDLVRWFGIPIAIIIFLLLLYPIIYLYVNKRIDNTNRYAIVAYLGYLFIAGTNPLLVSSTGMLVVIIMYALIGRYKVNINTTYINQDKAISGEM